MEEHPKWLASLNDGSTVEGPAKIGDKRWRELQSQVEASDKLRITQLRLQYRGRTWTASQRGDGYFFSIAYSSYGIRSRNIKQELTWGIGVVRYGMIFITWVDKYGDSRQEIRNKPWEKCCIKGVEYAST